MLYFVQFKPGGPIKIGMTICLSQRLEGYRYSHRELELLGVMDGARKEEKELLERFAHLRASPSVVSEWFEPGPDLLEFIKTRARHWDGKDEEPPCKQEPVIVYKADSRIAPSIKVWLKEFADFLSVPTPVVLDMALNEFARSQGFTKDMPSRQYASHRRRV